MIKRSARVRDLFDAAADLPAGERDALLNSEPDADVRAEVRALLDADANPPAILKATPQDLARAVEDDASHANLAGKRVGHYRIESVIGEGGAGVVCLAVRDGVDLRVALKLLRGALGDGARGARFEREQRVLAKLNHPNIARLIDVGTSDDGTPFLAMEYVQGQPITIWCDDKQLDLKQRLRLFLDLCDAVHFAHRHLVVHRDLKPSNVFVTNDGAVKLLDFGVAKLIDPERTDPGLTRTGMRVLSPAYASPEQVLGEPITTATDVHGLGVLLYELITGKRPYKVGDLGYESLVENIVQADVERPSARITDKPTAAADLDAIVLKALAKKGAARYAGANALRSDVLAYLEGRPVEARLPTVAYRTARFVRRNRVGVAIGALVVLLLASITGFVAVQANRARQALADAQELSSFLAKVFRSTDPVETRSADMPLVGFVDVALGRIDEFDGRPALQARMLVTLADAYIELGEYRRADSLARRSLALRRELGAGHDAEVAASMVTLGSALFEAGNRTGALESMRAGLTLQRSVLGSRSREVTNTMLKLSRVEREQGQYAEAEALAREALDTRLAVAGRYDDDVVDALIELGDVLWYRDANDVRADDALRRAVQLTEELHGRDDFRVDRPLTSLAAFLVAAGNTKEAEQVYQRSLALRRKTYGQNHPRVAAQLGNLGSVMLATGRAAQARGVFQQVIQQFQHVPGEDHSMLALALQRVSETYMACHPERSEGSARGCSRPDSAESYLTQALRMRVRLEGENSPGAAALYDALGALQVTRGRLGEAEASYRHAFEAQRAFYGARHPNTLRAAAGLGHAMDLRGRSLAADSLLRATLLAQEQVLGEQHTDLPLTLIYLGAVDRRQGRQADAQKNYDRALMIVRTSLAVSNPIRVEVVREVVAFHRARGKPEDGERIKREEAGVARASAGAK